jgi:hypothetical protein
MASAEKAILNVRVIHIAFVITIFLLVLVCRIGAPTEHPVSHTTVAAFGCAAAADIAVGFALRQKRMRDCEERFQTEPNAAKALEIWRVANITSFAQAETGAEVLRGELGHGGGIFCGWVSADNVVDATSSRLGEHAGAVASDSSGLTQAGT